MRRYLVVVSVLLVAVTFLPGQDVAAAAEPIGFAATMTEDGDVLITWVLGEKGKYLTLTPLSRLGERLGPAIRVEQSSRRFIHRQPPPGIACYEIQTGVLGRLAMFINVGRKEMQPGKGG